MSKAAYLHIMQKAAEKAAFGLIRDFGELEKLQVSRKGFKNFVTSADRNSENQIMYVLSQAKPDFSFLCEESGEISNENKSSIWIVDPIDGTTNFMRGIPYFAINIALMENEEIVAGLTLDPMRRECFKSTIDEGAFLGNRNRMRVSGREKLSEALVATTHTSTEIDLALTGNGAALRKNGSVALDLAYFSAGKYDVVIANDVCLWDIGSGIILIRESGGLLELHKKDNEKYDVIAASSMKLMNFIKKILD